MITYAEQPIAVRLREDQLAALETLAVAEGASLEELIRQGMDVFLDTKTTSTEHLVWSMQDDPLQELVGMFDSGLDDLAVNHDKYLAEIYGCYAPAQNRNCFYL